MPGPILQLVYASSASKLMSDSDLAEILRVSRRNNEAAEVTGALLYADGTFMQVLEGEPSAVEATYLRVSRDPRHRSSAVMLRAHVETRSFAD